MTCSDVDTTKSPVVRTAGEFLELVSTLDIRRIFRGQPRASWHLEPALDRGPVGEEPLQQRLGLAAALLADFKRFARPHLQSLPMDDWEWLALGQHHGLLTPLLDWTTNPLVALFFAVQGHAQGAADSAVWCYEQTNVMDPSSIPEPIIQTNSIQHFNVPQPLSISEVAIYFPVHVSPRITAQSACFTVHPPPKARGLYSWPGTLNSVLIPAEVRSDIRSTLETWGIHRAAMFPGLDGVAAYVNANQGGFGSRRTEIVARIMSRLLAMENRSEDP